MMTNEQKLQVNIAAAELLDVWTFNNYDQTYSELVARDIFKKPADCLAVVKKLGEKGVCISLCVSDKPHIMGWSWVNMLTMGNSNVFEIYEEAVGAACLEIKEIGESNGKI